MRAPTAANKIVSSRKLCRVDARILVQANICSKAVS